MVEFRILGPVEAVHDSSVLSLGGPRHRRLLAVLVLHAGRTVPAGTLTEALWGENPPRSAPAMLHVRVSELRSALHAAGPRVVVTSRGGYLLRVDPDDVDAERFERLLASGTAALAGGDAERASADLRAGLALWRGPALVEFADEPFARSHATRLGELRLQAMEARFAADLELGRYGELVAELEKAVAEHPLRERFWEQQMLALYRAGRQGEALRVYRTARRHIADQLGLDPGAALQRLHLAILNADPALDVTGGARQVDVAGPAEEASQRGVPAQLPADVPAFTGRAAHLDDLDRALTGDRRVPAAVVSGTAGVGKTALAIHWGHRNRHRYPDGQVYLNLRGYDPNRPMSAADALAYLLTALGVPNAEIPLDVVQREARYRTRVSGRRMLIVLDNASSEEQVRPLLPGTDTCAVLVTSRDSLAGLVARDGALRVSLDLLPHHDAAALLRRLVGEPAEADPGAVTALVDSCARLPLALRVAAELAVSRPDTPLSTLVDELADQRQRLDLLGAGRDPRAAVPSVFSWSLRQLPADAARTFRLLGLHPGANVDAYATAALTGSTLPAARRALGALTRAHLVQPTEPGRYGMHDLLRAYAASLADQQDAVADRTAALDRLLDHYLAVAAAAVLRLHPTDKRRWTSPVGEPATPAPDLSAPGAALAWLDAERQTLVGVVAHAARHGWPSHSVRLAMVLFRYLDAGHNFDALTVHQYASEAAERTGDIAGQAEAFNGLGIVHLRLGQYESAVLHLRRALALFERAGNTLGQARVLGNAGIAEDLQGHHAAAVEYQRRALGRYREVGDRLGQARCIDNLGVLERRLGRYQVAAEHHARALSILREVGDRYGQAIALNNLGDVERRLGRYPRATHHLTEALELSRQLGDRTGEAWSLTYLGGVHTRAGRASQASEHCREALAIFQETGDRDGQPRALNGLGEAAQAAGRPAEARTHHAAALALAVQIKAPDEQARAHAGLGRAHRALASLDRARQHYEHAIALYEGLDAPEADTIRAQLAEFASMVDGATR